MPTAKMEEKLYSVFMDNWQNKEWNKTLKKHTGQNPDVGDVYSLAVAFWANPTKYPDIYSLIYKTYGKNYNF